METPATAIPLNRHPAAVAVAIFNAWKPYRLRGYATGLVAGILAGGIVASLVTTAVGLAVALTGFELPIRLPWDAFIWTVVFASVAAFVGALAYAHWQPAELRAAAQSYLWLADVSEIRWRETTGLPIVPRDEAGIREFLRTVKPTPANAGERFGMWLALLDIPHAREAIAEMPRDSARERCAHASASWLADFVSEGSSALTLEELDALAEGIQEPRDRTEFRVSIAVQRARVHLASGRNWREPLAAVRAELGTSPDAVYDRFLRRPAFRRLLIACVSGVLVYWTAWFLLEPYFRVPP